MGFGSWHFKKIMWWMIINLFNSAPIKYVIKVISKDDHRYGLWLRHKRSYFVRSLKIILFRLSGMRRNNTFINRALYFRCLCDIGFKMMRTKTALKINKYTHCRVKHMIYKSCFRPVLSVVFFVYFFWYY